jgi:hypothetical protein
MAVRKALQNPFHETLKKRSANVGFGQVLDSEYFILAFVLTLIGVSGIILFNGPKRGEDSCYCIIPSPESSAMQGTAGILLIFGVMFMPIAILKGGLPGRRTTPPLGETVGSGRTYSPEWLSSGGQTVFGIALAVIGIDVLAVPAILVLDSAPVLVGGEVLAALGAVIALRGSRLRKK